MFNLVKNELIKIFSKKAIYVILIIYLILSIAGMALIKFIDNLNMNSFYFDLQLEMEQEYLDQIDKSTEEGKQMYSITQSEIECLELQKKYGENSWQSTIIEEDLRNLITDINYYKNGLSMYASNPDLSLEELQAEYNDVIKKLDTGDWKSFAEETLVQTKEQLEINRDTIEKVTDVNTIKSLKQEIEILKIKIQVLEWRLEKDICYGDENFDDLLQQYESYAESIIYTNYSYDIDENNYKEKESKDFDYNSKIQYQDMLSSFNITKYKIENGISSNMTASDSLKDLFTTGNGLLFTIIIAIMLTGTIISEEFNKGTIKLLLARPYSRRKILASKLIACLIALIISILVITIIEVIFTGFTYGFNTINIPVIIYNYSTNSIVTMNVFAYMFINLLKICPLIIILAVVAFMIGTLSANTAIAIVVSFLLYFVSSIVQQLVILFQAKWIRFIPTLNWDLTQYAYGSLPPIQGMTLGFSIAICAITIIAILVTTFESFVRKDIKNV